MSTWRVTCTCGDNFDVEANSPESAKQAMMQKMTPEVVNQHWMEKHPGQDLPDSASMEAMLDSVYEA